MPVAERVGCVNALFVFCYSCFFVCLFFLFSCLLSSVIANFFGKHSLDQISLDLFTCSKVSVKFGVWLNALFVTWSKVLIMNFYILSFDRIISHVFTRSKVLFMSFWVILYFWSSSKIRPFFLTLDWKF